MSFKSGFIFIQVGGCIGPIRNLNILLYISFNPLNLRGYFMYNHF
jgi:hypothetical protein